MRLDSTPSTHLSRQVKRSLSTNIGEGDQAKNGEISRPNSPIRKVSKIGRGGMSHHQPDHTGEAHKQRTNEHQADQDVNNILHYAEALSTDQTTQQQHSANDETLLP